VANIVHVNTKQLFTLLRTCTKKSTEKIPFLLLRNWRYRYCKDQ